MNVSGLGYLSSFLVIALIRKERITILLNFQSLTVGFKNYQILAMIVEPREWRGFNIQARDDW